MHLRSFFGLWGIYMYLRWYLRHFRGLKLRYLCGFLPSDSPKFCKLHNFLRCLCSILRCFHMSFAFFHKKNNVADRQRPKESWREETHRSFYTHRRFYTEKSLHKGAFYTQKVLHREVFTQRSFYTQKRLHSKLLHREAFTQRSFYTEKSLHRRAFTQRSFHKQKEAFTQRSLYTEWFLHTETFTHKRFYTEKSLHRGAFTRSNKLKVAAVL